MICSVILVRLKPEHGSSNNKQISMQAMLPVELADDETMTADAACMINELDKNLPGGYTLVFALNPKIVAKMYNITRHGLPLKYAPNGNLVKYKAIKEVHSESSWKLVAEAGLSKQRQSAGGRGSGSSSSAGKRSRPARQPPPRPPRPSRPPRPRRPRPTRRTAPAATPPTRAPTQPKTRARTRRGGAAVQTRQRRRRARRRRARRRRARRREPARPVRDADVAGRARGRGGGARSRSRACGRGGGARSRSRARGRGSGAPRAAPAAAAAAPAAAAAAPAAAAAAPAAAAAAPAAAAAAAPAAAPEVTAAATKSGVTGSTWHRAWDADGESSVDVASLPAIYKNAPNTRGWKITLSAPAKVTFQQHSSRNFQLIFDTSDVPSSS